MQPTLALVALAAVAYAAPQGVYQDIPSPGAAPGGCSASFSGAFQITAVNSTVLKRDIQKRGCGDEGSLTISLAGGQLTDAKGRTGYIASNYQFQFDAPPQNGAIYTGGFSVCSNGSLALGSSAIFYECLSGGFYNLYDRYWAAQCAPILIDILPCSSTPAAAPPVSQMADGQPTGTSVAPAVSQISDGQAQAASAIPISEIGDGQPQVPTAVISQISDGQIQGPTTLAGAPISQISDGQVQASTAKPAPISQISDGQVQASTAKPAPISQISDGQVQASTAAPAPISQISDGQIQASTAAPAASPTGAPISQISDGQIQASSAAAAPTTAAAAAPTSAAAVPASNATVSTAASPPAASSSSPATTPTVTPNSGNALTIGVQLLAAVGAVAVFLL